MVICFIGAANSAHIKKWCEWFLNRGHIIHVVTFTPGVISGVEVHLVDLGVDVNGSDMSKIKYLLQGKKIKRILDEIHPDIVNVHYATSYGLATALAGVKDYILSVWGSDIYDFPNRSFLHKMLLKYSLRKAKYLFSTSQSMADEASKYTNKEFEITPFGVDMELFSPQKRVRQRDGKLIIGTVKTLSDLYGIEYIIRAAAIIKNNNPEINLSVRLAGDGPDEKKYRELVKELGLDNTVLFLGRITQEQAAKEWANMDVAVIPSAFYESFGVAAVEAQACETPVIISDVAGLKETTLSGLTSIVVKRKDEKAIADAIISLYHDANRRIDMGQKGRIYVKEKYELNKCFSKIENYYLHANHNLYN